MSKDIAMYEGEYTTPNGKTTVEFEVIGSDLYITRDDHEIEFTGVMSKLSKANRDRLADIFGGPKEVAHFLNSIKNSTKQTREVTSVKYPSFLKNDKEGYPIYDSAQLTMHAVEKLMKSHSENYAFNAMYLNMHDGDTQITYNLASGEFADRILDEVSKLQEEQTIPAKALPTLKGIHDLRGNILSEARHMCRYESEASTGVRFLARDGKIYYDKDSIASVEIDEDGIREVERIPGFIRYAGAKDAGDIDYDAKPEFLMQLAKRVPIRGADFLTLMAWMVSVCIEYIGGYQLKAFGIHMLGPSGTVKTLFISLMLGQINPGVSHVIGASSARSERDLAVALSSGKRPIVLDNYSSKMDKNIHDLICNAFDNTPVPLRKLYTDSDEVMLHLSGVPSFTSTRPIQGWTEELATRVQVIKSYPVLKKNQMTERMAAKYFEENGPKIRGALLNTIHKVMKRYDDMEKQVMQYPVHPRQVPLVVIKEVLAEEWKISSRLASLHTVEMLQNELTSAAVKDVQVTKIAAALIEGDNCKIENKPRTLTEWSELFQLKDREGMNTGPAYLESILNSSKLKLKALGIEVKEESDADEAGLWSISVVPRTPYAVRYTRMLNKELEADDKCGKNVG